MLVLFLLETGLLSFKNHYQELGSGHYFIDAIVLSLAFTNGVRITNGYSVVGLFQNCFASRQVVYFLATDPNRGKKVTMAILITLLEISLNHYELFSVQRLIRLC